MNQHKSNHADENIFDAVAAAWPDGVPSAEITLWRVLTTEQRTLASARISAFLAYERGGRWSDLADAAGMKSAGFFTTFRRWREDRSIASVVPRLRPKAASAAGSRLDPTLFPMIEALVVAHPDWPRLRIAREARGKLDPPPAVTTIAPIVDEVRRRIERETLGGDDGLGRRLVIGATPVLVPAPEEGSFVATAGFVIDAATGIVFGHGVAGGVIEAIREAAQAAADRITALRERAAVATMPVFEFHLPEVGLGPMEAVVLARRFRDDADVEVHDPLGRRSGSRLVELIGSRLGQLRLKPRNEEGGLGEDEDGRSAVEIVRNRLAVELDRRANDLHGSAQLAVDRAQLLAGLRRFADLDLATDRSAERPSDR